MVLGLGGVGSGIALLAGGAGSDGKRYAREALQLWQKLQESNFDMSSLSPPEQRIAAEYFPQLYDAQVQGMGPELARDDAASQQAQALALRQMQDVASGGMPLADQLATQQIGRNVTQDAHRAQINALNSMRQRGRVGAGQELQAAQMGDQQAAELARGYGSDVAREAMLRRLGAIGAAGSMSGQMRGQSQNLAMDNANTVNRFNEMVANLRTNAAAQNAAATNQGRMYMTGERQRVADQNVMNRYNVDLQNLERQNALRDQLFQQRLAKTQGAAGQWNVLGQYQQARQAAKERRIQGIGQASDDIGGELLGGLL